jgi:hypothetical protein
MARKKAKGTELSVFKGREAKLNRAILNALALQSPQTVYGVHKEVTKQKGLKHVRYASINKRTKALENQKYIQNTGFRKTKAGFNASLYEITAKGYLVLALRTLTIEEIIRKLDEAQTLTAIGLLMI